jgi:hypothetical protein
MRHTNLQFFLILILILNNITRTTVISIMTPFNSLYVVATSALAGRLYEG